MASVWEVEDAGGKRFALKSPEARLDPFTVARFQREMRALRTLRHDNLVAAIDTFVDGDYVFLVMERVVGTSLAAVIAEGALPAAHAVAIAKQILAGIGHAHAHGYVHRDLKPDNILLVGDRVKVIDFGLCKPMEPSPEDDLGPMTTRGTVFGSPPYMSPEQALGKQLDGRSDLYAIGIILYEMLAGVAPFDGSAMEVAVAKIDKDPPAIRERAPHVQVDRVLEVFLAKLIARSPDARFASALAAREVLELYAVDRLAAATRLGVIDVERALALIAL
jgi:serine/threonine-protein kinase